MGGEATLRNDDALVVGSLRERSGGAVGQAGGLCRRYAASGEARLSHIIAQD